MQLTIVGNREANTLFGNVLFTDSSVIFFFLFFSSLGIGERPSHA